MSASYCVLLVAAPLPAVCPSRPSLLPFAPLCSCFVRSPHCCVAMLCAGTFHTATKDPSGNFVNMPCMLRCAPWLFFAAIAHRAVCRLVCSALARSFARSIETKPTFNVVRITVHSGHAQVGAVVCCLMWLLRVRAVSCGLGSVHVPCSSWLYSALSKSVVVVLNPPLLLPTCAGQRGSHARRELRARGGCVVIAEAMLRKPLFGQLTLPLFV
jgi:hypothetical protein